MADLAITNSFSAGTAIVASQMNTNFTDITTWANGSPNISASGNTTTIDGALTVTQATLLSDQIVSRGQFKDYAETVNDISGTKTAAFDISFTDGNVQTVTLGSGTFNIGIDDALASDPMSNSLTLLLTNGGAATATFVAGAHGGGGNAVHWAGGTAPTFTTSGIDVVCFTSFDGGTNYYGFVGGLDMSIPS